MKDPQEKFCQEQCAGIRLSPSDETTEDDVEKQGEETDEEALARRQRRKQQKEEAETFWAGRNHAMRRSGRIAA